VKLRINRLVLMCLLPILGAFFAVPSVRAQQNTPACCQVIGYDSNAQVYSAKVNSSGETFQFKVTKILPALKVGQPIYANLTAREVSLDGKAVVGQIVSIESPRPTAVVDTQHQKGNIPIVEGHQLHKVPILISHPLAPGRHELGKVDMGPAGALPVTITVDSGGHVTKIDVSWPADVRPQLLSFTSHPVYQYVPGDAVSTIGEAACSLTHVGGQCLYCSTWLWIEITTLNAAGLL